MNVETIMYIAEGAVGLFFLLQVLRLAKSGSHSMMLVFFLFGMIGLLVNNVYWITYEYIHPGIRMPFAVNEFGEAAGFLLFSSALSQAIPKNGVFYRKEMLGVILFTAASIALWIGWSGEWLQDILGGIVFGYFLMAVMRAARQTEVFSKKEWILIAAGSALVIAGQISVFFAPSPFREGLDLLCYGMMFAGIVYFAAKAFFAFRKKERAAKCLALSFVGHAWTISTIYMSAGIWYSLATVAFCVTLLQILEALKREVAGA